MIDESLKILDYLQMSTVRNIVNEIGRDQLAAALGLANSKSIQPAVTAGEFPSAWYPVIKELCIKKNIPFSLANFKWRKPIEEPAQ